MTLDFMEGFDWFTTAAKVLYKWTSGTVGGTANATPRYTGGRYAYNFNALVKILPTPGTVLVVGMAVRFNSSQTMDFLRFMENTTTHTLIRIEGLAIIGRRDGTALGTATAGLTEDTWQYLEVETTIHDSTGIIKVYLDGNLILNLTSVDTRNGGTGIVNRIQITGTSNDILIDDLYVKVGTGETRLGDVRVCTVLPNGAGATTEWDPSAGSNYQNVDDADPDDDSTYNSTSTAGEIDLYAYPDIAVAAGTIYGVQQTAVCRKDDAGTRTIKHIARPGSTNNLSAAVGIGSSYLGYSYMWLLNPDTAAAWAISEVNASQFGLEMEA